MKFYKSEAPNNISDFATEFNFDLLRPYFDSESKDVMERIAQYETYHKAMAFIFPTMSKEEIIKKALDTKSPYEFQTGYMRHAIWSIVNQSANGLTWSGIDKLDKDKSYLFIANHRDILLDSAILQIILDKEEFETSEITFGSNLMDNGFITDFGRMNRMFAVKREGTVKELYEISRQLSAYIRHTIVDKNTSVWIAQRNGRTKDGNDLTQTGLLKMLNLSNYNKAFKTSIIELNIVPLTISFEYEPCDKLKIQELYLSSLHSKYVKAPGEDLTNILTGIKQPKGKIHLAFGTPIKKELDELDNISNENEKIKLLTSIIDKQIHQNYKLNAVNYIAYDIINQTNLFQNSYTEAEKQEFIDYTNQQISEIIGEEDILRNLFIKMYSMPVENKM
jgi:1-acyl-sn-glycerol-3-phosphate acyltransferase